MKSGKWSYAGSFDARVILESYFPEEWHALYPREIAPEDNYSTPRSIMAEIVLTLCPHMVPSKTPPPLLEISEELLKKDATHRATLRVYAEACRNQANFYCVNSDLLEALSRTEPPNSMLLKDIKFALPSVILLFPVGAKYAYMVISLIDGSRPHIMGLEFARIEDGLGVVCREGDTTWVNTTKFEDVTLGNVIHAEDREFLHGYNPMTGKYHTCDTKQDITTLQELSRIALNVLFLLAAKPDMVRGGGVVGRIKSKSRGEKVDLYSCRWIGKDYQIPTAPALGGSHASPHAHIRKGHWRDQRVGEGRKEIKNIWIEPCWVSV